MKLHRIKALLIRHLYLYQRSVPRLMDIFFWPILELLLWGFLSIYLEKLNLGGLNVVTVLLGAIIFWDLMSQSQRTISTTFLEEVWERNLLNIFVSPLKLGEFLVSSVLIAVVRIIIVGVVMAGLAWMLYQFNLLMFGFYLILFMLNLLIFGWTLGFFTTGIILRFGSAAQVLAFGLVFLLQPFSAVFYPVSVLPQALQYVANILPSTHVFEGMRAVIATGTLPVNNLIWAFGTNIFYLVLVLWFFARMFARVKNKGMLMKLD
ncbi:MAG: ABC transporter permease [Patescibacteria group bacterium]